MNEEHISNFYEHKQDVEIEFTEEWSDHVDGVQLFERATTLSSDIKITYKNQKIAACIPKSKQYLSLLIEFVETSKKLTKE